MNPITAKARVVLFNKPYGVLSQFTDTKNIEEKRATLADFIHEKGVYPAGRLDRDSEGLLLLTDNGKLQHQLANPAKKTWKTYLVQVEGDESEKAMQQLRDGVELKDGMTRPARVVPIKKPSWLWERDPPVRFRKSVPDHWLEIRINEGRNRQVRRMTAAVGLPTLRLVRVAIGDWQLDQLSPGEYNITTIAFKESTQNELEPTRHRRGSHRKRQPVSHGKRNKQRR